MTTHDVNILTAMSSPDTTGDCFFQPAEVAMTLTTDFGTLKVLTFNAPAADAGIYGILTIPQTFVDTPVIVIRGVIAEIDNDMGFGFQQVPIAVSETFDIALEGEDLGGITDWTGLVIEDVVEITITVIPDASFVAGDVVPFFLFRNADVDDQTAAFHLTGLFFRFNDA